MLNPLEPQPRDVYAALAPAVSLLLSINVCLGFCKWCRVRENLVTSSAKKTTEALLVDDWKGAPVVLNQLSKVDDVDESVAGLITVTTV